MENRSARILTFSSYDTNADCLLEGLGWENLETQRQIQKSVMVYKSVNGLAPEYLNFVLNFPSAAALRATLLDTLLANWLFLFLALNYLKNSCSCSGAVTWNSLPLELRQANSLNSFRSGCSDFSLLGHSLKQCVALMLIFLYLFICVNLVFVLL